MNKDEILPYVIELSIKQFADADILEFLLQKGINPNTIISVDKNKNSILGMCIGEAADVEKIKVLYKYGANINQIDTGYYNGGTYYERSVLCQAVRKKNLKVVKFLLENGADANAIYIQGKDKWWILGLSIWSIKNIEIAKLLIEHKANVNAIEKGYYDDGTYYERSILSQAVRENDIKMVKLLLENGADANCIDIQGKNKWWILGLSIWSIKNIEIAKLLIEHKANVNAIEKGYYDDGTYYERSMLCQAVRKNNIEMTKLLLENGADTNSVYIHGNEKDSLLKLSIKNTKNIDIVKLLIKYGIDLNVLDRYETYYERSILCEAVRFKSLEIIRILLEIGVNISKTEEFTLSLADMNGNIKKEVECRGSALFL